MFKHESIATNAGGIHVIRWGNTRDWVLGLKVVTGEGKLLELNGSLFKNQAGYDLRAHFIGSEGTLGVITEATLKLCSPPKNPSRLLCGLSQTGAVLEVLKALRNKFSRLNMFEFFMKDSIELVMKHHGLGNPFQELYPVYILVELDDEEEIEEQCMQLVEDGLISDIVIGQNSKQDSDLLSYRELISETLSSHFTIHKNDISIPVSTLTDFLNDLSDLSKEIYPKDEVVLFGHAADGNLHLNVLKTSDKSDEDFYSYCHSADHKVFELVQRYKGSVSAEHGVGLLKKDFLSYSRTEDEIEYMRKIKAVFDPDGILNPGKIFD